MGAEVVVGNRKRNSDVSTAMIFALILRLTQARVVAQGLRAWDRGRWRGLGRDSNLQFAVESRNAI